MSIALLAPARRSQQSVTLPGVIATGQLRMHRVVGLNIREARDRYRPRQHKLGPPPCADSAGRIVDGNAVSISHVANQVSSLSVPKLVSFALSFVPGLESYDRPPPVAMWYW